MLANIYPFIFAKSEKNILHRNGIQNQCTIPHKRKAPKHTLKRELRIYRQLPVSRKRTPITAKKERGKSFIMPRSLIHKSPYPNREIFFTSSSLSSLILRPSTLISPSCANWLSVRMALLVVILLILARSSRLIYIESVQPSSSKP